MDFLKSRSVERRIVPGLTLPARMIHPESDMTPRRAEHDRCRLHAAYFRGFDKPDASLLRRLFAVESGYAHPANSAVWINNRVEQADKSADQGRCDDPDRNIAPCGVR